MNESLSFKRFLLTIEGLVQKKFVLDKDGFEIFPKLFLIDPALAERVYTDSVNESDAIFNNAGVSDDEDDGQRSQLCITSADVPLMNQWSNWLKRKYPNHVMTNPVVLISKSGGCKPQRAHTDYTQDSLQGIGDKMPLACLLALEDETYFDTWPGAIKYGKGPFRHHRVMLSRGDVLVFRGDFVHAGAAFDRKNVRLHAYLDMEGVERDANVTYFMDCSDSILKR